MPEARARRLRDDDDLDPPRPRARLRLLSGEQGADDRESGPGHRPGAGHPRRPAGRPHPRSRIRPEDGGSSGLLERNEARLAAVTAPRTIVVTGQPTRAGGQARRIATGRSPALARVGARPDRLALWAVGLGLLMAFLAAATAEAAPLAPAGAPALTAGH